MKLTVDKMLYHWYSKVYPNYKSKAFQVSLLWSPSLCFNLDISPVRTFGTNWFYYLNIFGILVIDLNKSNNEEDHAGLRINLNILGIDVDYENCDVRHWDYDSDMWEACDINQMNRNYYINHERY